jgi:uncharacterized ion transporter superfamily protein YfcC
MYGFDLVLFVGMAVLIIVLVYQFIGLIRKDPDFWLIARTNKEYMKHWDHLEKMQSEKNKSIINLKKETEPDNES